MAAYRRWKPAGSKSTTPFNRRLDIESFRVNEEAVRFGTYNSLVGIVAGVPEIASQDASTAVILLNAGIVHRVGAGRVYVNLARALASAGFVTLRFDFSGIGDSPARQDGLAFPKSAVAEAQEAMEFLCREKRIHRFVLLGGCSGARIAFDAACRDSRVIGALLINFPSSDEESDGRENADAAHRSAWFYYRRFAFFNFSSWQRLLAGRANYRQLLRTLWFGIKHVIAGEEEFSSRHQEFRCALTNAVHRGARITFICSEGDHRLDELRAAGGKLLKKFCAERTLALDVVKNSDHTFSTLADQQRLIEIILMRAQRTVATTTESAICHATVSPSAFQHQLQS
jgi:pimeloyl-ACP methyl ester carboxylesterase